MFVVQDDGPILIGVHNLVQDTPLKYKHRPVHYAPPPHIITALTAGHSILPGLDNKHDIVLNTGSTTTLLFRTRKVVTH